MVNKGTRLTIYVEGATTKTWLNPAGFQPSDLQNGVMDILTKKFVGVTVSVMPRSSVYIGYLSWPYRGEVHLTTTVAYGNADDAASIVANAFYQVGGALPGACVDGYGKCSIELPPSVDPSKEPTSPFSGWMIFAVVALVAVTATGVFVAKRG